MNGADTLKTGSSEHPNWIVQIVEQWRSLSFGSAYGLLTLTAIDFVTEEVAQPPIWMEMASRTVSNI